MARATILIVQSENSSSDQGGPARSFIEQARRRQIIDAAIEAIAELGYRGASFVQIAKRAGISASLIPYHFTSKAELVAAVAASIDADLDAALGAATEQAVSYLAAARALMDGFVRYADRHRSQMLTLQQLSLGMSPSERAAHPVLHEEHALRDWQEFLREGRDAGEFRDLDLRTGAVALHGMLTAIPRELFVNPDADVDGLADELATVVERAIRADDPTDDRPTNATHDDAGTPDDATAE